MALTTPYNSPNAMAHAVHNPAKATFGTLVARPYNFNDPDHSPLWWLVPSNSYPAHCDTKFFFRKAFDDAGMIDVGIHAEKGYGTIEAMSDESGRSASKVIDNWWHWGKFKEMVIDGRMLKAMQAATLATNAPLWLRVYTYFDVGAGEDALSYRLDPGSASLMLDRDPTLDAGILKRWQVEEADALPELLNTLTANQWVWADVWISTPFAPVAENGAWDSVRIWREYLSHLSFAVASLHLGK